MTYIVDVRKPKKHCLLRLWVIFFLIQATTAPLPGDILSDFLAPRSQVEQLRSRLRVVAATNAPLCLGDVLNKRELEKVEEVVPVSLHLKYPLSEIPLNEFLHLFEAKHPGSLQKETAEIHETVKRLTRFYQVFGGIADRDPKVSREHAQELGRMVGVVRLLSEVGRSLMIRELLSNLRNRRMHVRVASAIILGELVAVMGILNEEEKRDIVFIVSEMSENPDWNVRKASLETLGKMAHVVGELGLVEQTKVIARIFMLLADSAELVRQSAAQALGQIAAMLDRDGQYWILEQLSQRLDDPQESLRLAGTEGMGGVIEVVKQGTLEKKVKVFSKLCRRLKDENHYVRRASAHVLGLMMEVAKDLGRDAQLEVLEALMAALGDPDKIVRKNSVEALGTMAEIIHALGVKEKVTAELEKKRSGDRDFFVRDVSEKALDRIYGRDILIPKIEAEEMLLPIEVDEKAMAAIQVSFERWGLSAEEFQFGIETLHLFLKQGISLERFWDILRSEKRDEILKWLSCAHQCDISLGQDPELWMDPARLRDELVRNETVGVNKKMVRWAQWEEYAMRALKNTALGNLIYPYLIVTLRLLREDLSRDPNYRNVQEKFWLRGVSEDLLVDLVGGSPLRKDVRSLKRLLRSVGDATQDGVFHLRNLASQLGDAVLGGPIGYDATQGLIGWFRTAMHNRASPSDLEKAMAYKEFIESDGQSEAARTHLITLGYRPNAADVVPLERKTQVLGKLEELIDRLRVMYGQGVSESIQDALNHFVHQSGKPAEYAQNFLNSRKTDLLEDVRALTEVRLQLARALSREGDLAFVQGMRLDNALEVELYRLVGVIHQRETDHPMGLQDKVLLLKHLVQNSRLSGYPTREFTNVLGAWEDWERRWGKVEVSQTGWLELYRLIRELEIEVGEITEETLERYQRMAETLARAFDVKKDEWVKIENFSAELLRSEPLYHLSLYLNEVKGEVARKVGKKGWEVVVSGRGTGKVRMIRDLVRDLRDVKPHEIVVLSHLPPEAPPIRQAAGIISFRADGLLSHPALRARANHVPYAVVTDPRMIKLIRNLEGKWLRLEANALGVTWEEVSETDTANPVVGKARKIVVPKADLRQTRAFLDVAEYQPEWVGEKAFRLGAIESTPHMTIPFGVYEEVLKASDNKKVSLEIHKLMETILDNPEAIDISEKLKRLRFQITQLEIPGTLLDEIFIAMKERFSGRSAFLRSSTNAEDLPGYAGAGLYDSYGGIRRRYELEEAILKVWASVWNDRAFYDRQAQGIDHRDVKMAVLVHEMISADYSFVIHTMDPVRHDPDKILIELVQGLGQSLVDGDPKYQGSPYRLIYSRSQGTLSLEAFPDKLQRVVMDGTGRLATISTHYHPDEFLLSHEGFEKMAKICLKAITLEERFGRPQDIEGVIYSSRGTYKSAFVQSRDQVILPVEIVIERPGTGVLRPERLLERSV